MRFPSTRSEARHAHRPPDSPTPARARGPFTRLAVASGVLLAAASVSAENRIDTQLPLAPELAAYGDFLIGTREIDLVNPDQVDVVAIPAPDDSGETGDAHLPVYDRPLRVQLWYPRSPSATGSRALQNYLRDGITQAPLVGRAVRYASPLRGSGPFPLVIVSHGYPGNRFLLSHLAENIASKGYIVASIDHTDSTYRTQSAFGSTLRNRTLDQRFVLDEMERLNTDAASFLEGKVDTSRTAIVGYSMGGYGAVITAGGALAPSAYDFPFSPPRPVLDLHLADSEEQSMRPDPRILTAIAFAPWGRNTGFFDAESLAGVAIPMLFVAGSEDDVSLYEGGVRSIFEETVNVDRALLTYVDANHNAGAPVPAPAESFAISPNLDRATWDHYGDAVWDTARMNNIAQHFATAWLGKYLKDEADKDAFLDLVEDSNDGVISLDEAGNPTEDDTYWTGFPARMAKGLRFETRAAGE